MIKIIIYLVIYYVLLHLAISIHSHIKLILNGMSIWSIIVKVDVSRDGSVIKKIQTTLIYSTIHSQNQLFHLHQVIIIKMLYLINIHFIHMKKFINSIHWNCWLSITYFLCIRFARSNRTCFIQVVIDCAMLTLSDEMSGKC